MPGVCQCRSRIWSWRLWSPGRVCWIQAGATPQLLVFDSEIHSGLFSAPVWCLLVPSCCISAPGGRVYKRGVLLRECCALWLSAKDCVLRIPDRWHRRDPQGRNLTLRFGEINREQWELNNLPSEHSSRKVQVWKSPSSAFSKHPVPKCKPLLMAELTASKRNQNQGTVLVCPKTQQWPQHWKSSNPFQSKEEQGQRMSKLPHSCTHLTC